MNIDFFDGNYYNQNMEKLQAINWIRYANIAHRFSACLQSRKELFRLCLEKMNKMETRKKYKGESL